MALKRTRAYFDTENKRFIIEVVKSVDGTRDPEWPRIVLDLEDLVDEDGTVHDVSFKRACVKVNGIEKEVRVPMSDPYLPDAGTTGSETQTTGDKGTTG